MVQRIARLLILAAALALPALAGWKPVPLPPMTPEKWRADVDVFARELPKRHKNAFHTITKERFAAEVAALREKAATANDDEMIVGLMKIAAAIGDGHTRLILPSSTRQFPLAVAQVEGHYRVVRAAGAATDLIGGKLIRIDDTPVEDAIPRLRTVLSQAESEVYLTAFAPVFLSFAEVLHGLGITKSAAEARFTVTLDDGSQRTATVAAIPTSAQPQWRGVAASPPLFRQRGAESFWFQWLPESSTVYVAFRRYDDLRAKSRELWTFVDSHPVKTIAIDLRQNGGGDFTVGRKYLVDELARRPKLRAYVLIGPRTFSAALKNAIDFREVAKATLVGETIGERPNSYSENDEFALPNSRMGVSYSTRYYKFLATDGLVTPDQEIVPAWADWVAGRDPVLEWVTRQ